MQQNPPKRGVVRSSAAVNAIYPHFFPAAGAKLSTGRTPFPSPRTGDFCPPVSFWEIKSSPDEVAFSRSTFPRSAPSNAALSGPRVVPFHPNLSILSKPGKLSGLHCTCNGFYEKDVAQQMNPQTGRSARGAALNHPCLGLLNGVCAGEPPGANGIKVMFVGQGEQELFAGGSPGRATIACDYPSVILCQAEHRGLVGEASREPTLTN